jgi:hypothetical protein
MNGGLKREGNGKTTFFENRFCTEQAAVVAVAPPFWSTVQVPFLMNDVTATASARECPINGCISRKFPNSLFWLTAGG